MGMGLGLGAGVPISGCCFMSLGPALRPALAAAKARSHSFNSERRVCEWGVGFGSASAVVRAILVLPRLAWDGDGWLETGTVGLGRGGDLVDYKWDASRGDVTRRPLGQSTCKKA